MSRLTARISELTASRTVPPDVDPSDRHRLGPLVSGAVATHPLRRRRQMPRRRIFRLALCPGVPGRNEGVVMRRRFWLGSVLSLATLMMLVLPFGAQASPTAASSHLWRGAVLTHWWQARENATDSVGTDNGRLVGVGFGPGVKGGTDQAFAFYNGARQVVFN